MRLSSLRATEPLDFIKFSASRRPFCHLIDDQRSGGTSVTRHSGESGDFRLIQATEKPTTTIKASPRTVWVADLARYYARGSPRNAVPGMCKMLTRALHFSLSASCIYSSVPMLRLRGFAFRISPSAKYSRIAPSAKFRAECQIEEEKTKIL